MVILSVITLISFIADRAICSNKSAPILFLVITLIIGTLISYSQPPVTGLAWDDQIHYDRTVNFKSQILRSERTVADDSLSNLAYSFKTYYSSRDSFIQNIIAEDSVKIASRKNYDLTFYSSLAYLPSALSMAVFELLGADIIKTFIISRMANVFLYVE